MNAKVTISVGSIEVNGKVVGSMSGFQYEGDVDGLAAAVKAKLWSVAKVTAGKVEKLTKAQREALLCCHRWGAAEGVVRPATYRNLMARGLVKRYALFPASRATYSVTDAGKAALAAAPK